MNNSNCSVVRAIRGPVTLITVGGLFALNNFTPYRFDQTWPVILIVFGLLSLLGRATAKPAAEFPPAGTPGPAPYAYTAPPGTYRQTSYPQTAPPSPAVGEQGPASNPVGGER